jgi:4-carboxymuconolactone decarboxylase
MKKTKAKFYLLILLSLLNFKQMDAQTVNNTKALNAGQQSMVSISSLTAAGNIPALKIALNDGLDSGLTINEIKEELVQLYAYCGFPRSLNGINALMTVIDERKAAGKTLELGRDATAIAPNINKYQAGKAVLQQLTGREEKELSGANAFAPAIDAFLKEHLFADIFGRDVFSYPQRELITITALASITGVENQLQAHIGMGMNTGLTPAQLQEAFAIVGTHLGEDRETSATDVLNKVLATRQ